jgi:hypothetical protein
MDAVITWVDGSDPAHQLKLRRHLDGCIETPESSASTRFADNGEIEFSVRSLIRFAPWVDNIYIVTDQQTPHFYSNSTDQWLLEKIKIVDHQVLFSGYSHALPVFNSLSIEALLWNIPGLSDDFIYLNDDMMLIRPVPVSAFRTANEYILKGKLRRKKHRKLFSQLKKLWPYANNKRTGYRKIQEKCAELIGFNDYFIDLPHCPHILNCSALKNFFTQNLSLLEVTLGHKFRDPEQVWSVSLFCHQLLLDQTARIDNQFKTVNIKADRYSLKKVQRILGSAESSLENYFLCVQSLDMANTACQEFIKAWMAKRLLADNS